MLVHLPSFVRKFGRPVKLIELVASCGGQLKRIRRSRNWQIEAKREQMLALSAQLKVDDDAMGLWVLNRIQVALGVLSELEINQLAQLTAFYSSHQGEAQQDRKKLELELLQLRLAALLQTSPNLSAMQLMALSDCTLAQARLAIDDNEDF